MLARVDVIRLLLGSLVLGGCPYQADSFSHLREPFPGVYVSVKCLDIAINRKEHRGDRDVISYQFGNRCDQPAVVDLASAKVYGHPDAGEPILLRAYDPLREIRPMLLDARSVGRESIEYPSGATFQRVCIDAASIARATPARWICFKD